MMRRPAAALCERWVGAGESATRHATAVYGAASLPPRCQCAVAAASGVAGDVGAGASRLMLVQGRALVM